MEPQLSRPRGPVPGSGVERALGTERTGELTLAGVKPRMSGPSSAAPVSTLWLKLGGDSRPGQAVHDSD